MAAYVIAEFEFTETDDREIARLDKRGVGRFGERILVDSSRCEILTGGWTPQHLVVLEFPTMERAQSWWSARARSAPAQLKRVKRKMVLVDGLYDLDQLRLRGRLLGHARRGPVRRLIPRAA